MSKLQEIIRASAKKARQKRAAVFRQNFKLDETTKILDIGSETGENIRQVLEDTKVAPENVYIADIDAEAVKAGHEKFGYQPILLGESGALPFADAYFDVVYCSSVIEHVTVPKGDVWKVVTEDDFRQIAAVNQKTLANEIARVGRQFFVQTPALSFPIESHTWMPFFGYLSRPQLIKAMRFSNRFWIKQALPDFYLLGKKQMRELFPDAKIFYERKFGLVKSIMAIKSLR